jgi:stage II sporulation protein R
MKKQNKYMKSSLWQRVCLMVCVAILLGAAVWYAFPVHGEEKLYDAVIRLHVIANSDSDADQADKLAVRDALLVLAAGATEGCRDRASAQAALAAQIPTLQARAAEVLAERGNLRPVQITLGTERYPTRSYDSFCFPAGEYLSLQVKIGEAAGENFWCVLFPPMCLGAARVSKASAEDAMISVGLSADQYAVITETHATKYKLRFRILEFIQELR